MLFPTPRMSKRKYQQQGTPATQKLGHIIRPKTLARRTVVLEAFYVDAARIADIGVAPQYRHAYPCQLKPSVEAWNATAKQWDADHDVVKPPKVVSRKSRKRNKTPRAAKTYRAERRNALRTGVNGGMKRAV